MGPETEMNDHVKTEQFYGSLLLEISSNAPNQNITVGQSSPVQLMGNQLGFLLYPRQPFVTSKYMTNYNDFNVFLYLKNKII